MNLVAVGFAAGLTVALGFMRTPRRRRAYGPPIFRTHTKPDDYERKPA